MAILICCPCGLPLDCENIDLVIDAACPRCKRNLDLEFEDESGARRRAVLTILEGPIWKGEQFVMPIGQQLTLGTGTDGWLSLEGENLEEAVGVSLSGVAVICMGFTFRLNLAIAISLARDLFGLHPHDALQIALRYEHAELVKYIREGD